MSKCSCCGRNGNVYRVPKDDKWYCQKHLESEKGLKIQTFIKVRDK